MTTPDTWQKPITAALKIAGTPEALAGGYRYLQTSGDTRWWRDTLKPHARLVAFLRTGGDKAGQLAGWVEAGRAIPSTAQVEQAAPVQPTEPQETAASAWRDVEKALRNGRKTDHMSTRCLSALRILFGSPSAALNALYTTSDYDLSRTHRPAFERAYQEITA